MNTSQFMDKQIMDLSASVAAGSSPQSKSATRTHDFMALQDDDDHQDHVTDDTVIKKDEILPNYDFQPLRPSLGSAQNLNLDTANGGGGSARVWNSVDSKAGVNSTTTALRKRGRFFPKGKKFKTGGEEATVAVAMGPVDKDDDESERIAFKAREAAKERAKRRVEKTAELLNDQSSGAHDISTAEVNYESYGLVDSVELAKVSVEKDRNVLDATMVAEIDRTMKKHADALLHALEGISARLTQLETITRHLENSVDDLQVSVGDNHGSNDGKMRQLENILKEVHSTVRDVRDNQDKVEAQLHLAKLQISKPDQHSEKPHTDNVQQIPSSQQPLAPQVLPAFPSSFGSHHLQPNQPPAPPHMQNLPPQIPNQYSQNQTPSDLQRDPYYQPGPPQEPQPQQYVLPSTQQPQPQLQLPPQEPQPQKYLLPPTQQQQLPPHVAPPSHQQQYQPAVHQQYSQPPPQPAQQLPSFTTTNPPQPQLSLSQITDEMSYPSSQSYPPNVRQHPSHSTNTAPPPQQFYGAPPHKYEPPSGRANSGFSPGYAPQTGSNEPYSYSGPSQYGGNSTLKPHGSGSGSGGYPQLPTARLLPQALPSATAASPGSGSSGTGNRVPVDDVVDKVTTMGFPRDVVKATVRKLTENGQAVDLNIVLDKLMNDGDIQQPPKGWFGR